jgi:hypothetical protein
MMAYRMLTISPPPSVSFASGDVVEIVIPESQEKPVVVRIMQDDEQDLLEDKVDKR